MGRIENFPGSLPPMPAVARILGQFDRDKLGAAIEVMIALLDLTQPDTEAEPMTWPEDCRAIDCAHLPDDSESAGDEDDAAWIEWHAMHPNQRRGPNRTAGQEDDEAAGDEEDGDFAEDEPCARFAELLDGPGCSVADPGEDDEEADPAADVVQPVSVHGILTVF